MTRKKSPFGRCQSKRRDPRCALPPLWRLSSDGESRKRLVLTLDIEPNQPSVLAVPPIWAVCDSVSNPPPPMSICPNVRPPPSNPDRVVTRATPETFAPYSGGMFPVKSSSVSTKLGSIEVANCPENWSLIGMPSIT